ncbi:G2 protein, putative [Babesia caballi]|uniref:G2 protein, putative n=1 Tax=Babesia caballi TaxID=5871 RepID=A0AAV4LTN0_BABCB|nr:G2 protein, putative [Babesia caballi]
MASLNGTHYIDEVRNGLLKKYPGIEEQITNAFTQHDIVGDGLLPYHVVESLLRHCLTEFKLDDYVAKLTNSEGLLAHNFVADHFVGTSLADINESSVDRMVTCDEMISLAIAWLKVISDMHHSQDDAAVAPAGGAFWCAVAAPVCNVEVAHVIASDAPVDESPRPPVVVEGELEPMSQPQYVPHVNDEQDEKILTQKNVEHYIATLLREAAANRQKGVKCFVYPTSMTATGTCVSAGAAVPQRKARAADRRRAPMGCC